MWIKIAIPIAIAVATEVTKVIIKNTNERY